MTNAPQLNGLAHRQSTIQEKRKKTPWREFVMEICSRKSLMFYKNQGMISIYPDTVRSPKLIHFKSYDDQIVGISNTIGENFFSDLSGLLVKIGLANLSQIGAENSDFSDTNINSKGVYLSNVVLSTGHIILNN